MEPRGILAFFFSLAIRRAVHYGRPMRRIRSWNRLSPNFSPAYALPMFDYISLNRVDQAKATYEQALEHQLKAPCSILRYTRSPSCKTMQRGWRSCPYTAYSDTNLLHRELKPARQKIGAPWTRSHT